LKDFDAVHTFTEASLLALTITFTFTILVNVKALVADERHNEGLAWKSLQ
jgi:hypothetical protein